MKGDRFVRWLHCLALSTALTLMTTMSVAAGTWTDPAGDVTLPNADILSGSATVFEGRVDLRVQFSAHPFPSVATHVVSWCFDTDQDATTGDACGGSTFLGAERGFGIDSPRGLETCDLGLYGGSVAHLLEASEIWFDATSNTLRLVFPLSLISGDPTFNYAVTSVFGGSFGANEFAPDSPNFASPGGFFTSDVGELPPFGGTLLCAPRAIAIHIDIKPGSFPNTINPKSEGILRVAVLTTGDFDAATVDPGTIRFGALGASAAPVSSVLQDVDGDGDQDLVLKFNTPDTGIACGTTVAFLTASTLDGHALTGSDSIRTSGCP